MRILLSLILISLLATGPLAAQDSHSEENFQTTLEEALKVRGINEDSSIILFRLALNTFQTPLQKIELLNELGRAYELAWKLDTSLMILEEAKRLAEQQEREDFLMSILYNFGLTYNSYGEKQRSINFLQQSRQLAIQLKNQEAEFGALQMIGRVYSSISLVDSVFVYLHKALDLSIQWGDNKKQSRTLMILGNSAARANQVPRAMDYYNQSIAVAEEMKDYSTILAVYSNMGYTHSVYGNYPAALEAYQKGLQTAEDIGSVAAQADMSMQLGSVYTSLNDLDQAIFYYDKAENIDQNGFAKIRKAEIYLVKKEFRKALNLYLQGSRIGQLENESLLESQDLIKIGTCYEKLDLLDSARFYYGLALNNATQFKSKEDIVESLLGLASINLIEGKLNLALTNAQQGFNLSEERENGEVIFKVKDELIMKALQLLYEIHKNLGNDGLALEYHERFRDQQDSLFSRQNISQIAQMEVQSQFDQQKQQLEFERQQERQQARSRQLFILIIAGSLALFLFLSYRNVRAKKRANTQLQQLNNKLAQQNEIVEGQKKKLEELDQMKSRFFTNISHEFRTPLTIIGGMIEQIRKSPQKWLKKGSKLIERNNSNLLNLVNQILDLRKLESGSLKLELIQGNVVFYLRYILESFHSLSQNKTIGLHFTSKKELILMDYDKEKLLRIVSNLLSNAIKFTPDQGHVYLSVEEITNDSTESILQISVKDTGIGIPEAKLPHIFDRFYQVDDSSTREGEGTGIGLSLTKELVKLMNGHIEVTSEEQKGSVFTVHLPISRNASLEQNQVESPSVELPEETKAVEDVEYSSVIAAQGKKEIIETAIKNNKSTLLIIEDNPDLVEYLESLLSNHYDLEIARDGREGIEIALEQIPDLILSDVMMPHKDGFEVCETLKNDQRTSHIPIVLLTAKADAESRIAGLKRGADAYLAKPFNQEELFIRLEKLHQLRLQLQTRYKSLEPGFGSQESLLTTSDSVQTSTQAEDEFMQSLRENIEANLDNENFAVPELCRAIGMSRTQLHMKIKALTSRSTTHYIRSIRLYKAKELLQQGNLNVTQVAFEVGFQSRTYFSRAFNEEFGVSPKEFMNN